MDRHEIRSRTGLGVGDRPVIGPGYDPARHDPGIGRRFLARRTDRLGSARRISFQIRVVCTPYADASAECWSSSGSGSGSRRCRIAGGR
jgi:hypothetical protein